MKTEIEKKENLGPGPILMWILVLVLIAGLFFLANSSLFNVTGVTVFGTVNVSPEEVIRLSGVTSETNIVRLNEAEVRRNIEESNFLLEVTDVRRVFPTSVEIYVHERIPAGQIGTVNGYFLVDEDGVALGVRAVPEEAIPEIRNLPISQPVGGLVVPTEETDRLSAAMSVMKAIRACGLSGRITWIDVENPYRLRLCYNAELTVILAGGATAQTKLARLEDTIAAVRDKLTGGQELHLENEGGYYLK